MVGAVLHIIGSIFGIVGSSGGGYRKSVGAGDGCSR